MSRAGATAAALTLASLLAAGWGLSRLTLRQDVLSLVGDVEDGAHREAVEVLSRFGAFDVLLVDVSRPDGAEPTADARSLAAALRAQGGFRQVLFELDPAALSALYPRLFEARHLLFAPPDDVGPGVEAAGRDLMTPMSALMEGWVARDPLDHRARLVALLEGLAPRLRLDTSAGRLMSEDGRHALLVVEPEARALDVTAARAVLDSLHALAPAGARVVVFGPHVFAVAAADGVRRDIHASLLGSGLGILALFLLALRRLRYVVAVALPVGVGALWALGLLGGLGVGLHGITLGFGGVMLGVGIDYGVHLLVHYRQRRARRPDEAPAASMQATLRQVGGSVLMGALTTGLAFVTLLVAGTPALDELVTFLGLGVAGALAFTLGLMPRWPALMGGGPRPLDLPGAPPPAPAGLRWVALAVAAGLSLVSVVGATRVRFDGDIRHLDHQPPEVRAVEAEIFQRYAPPAHPTLVVVRGEDVQATLRRAERARDLLAQAQAAGLVAEVSGVTRLVPSEARQRAHLAAHDAALEAQVDRAAAAAGLEPAYFAPFHAELAAARAGQVRPVTPEDLAGTPLAPLLQRGLHVTPEGAEASLVVHTGRGAEGAARLAPQVADALTALGATVVSGAALAERVVGAVKDAVARLAALSLLLVGLALLAYYRRPGRALLALLPAGLGLLWTAGAVGLSGVPFNIVSVGAFALVSGMGVDYGIFVTDALVSPEPDAWPATLRSVLLAAATTVLGFGSLVVADNPVMWSLGFAVATGIVASIAAAAGVVPALYALGLGRDEAPRSWVALAGLAALAGLSAAVVAVWATGARSAYQGEVVAALLVNLACMAWILRRGRRHG